MRTVQVHVGPSGQKHFDEGLPEFPVGMAFDRVPGIGERIEFNDHKGHFEGDDWAYANILLEVKRVVWTAPQLGHNCEPALECVVIGR